MELRAEGMRPVALVTGVARGIGLGIAAWLIAEGWQVALVAWLLSPQAGFVTAQEFIVDGGMTRRMIYQP